MSIIGFIALGTMDINVCSLVQPCLQVLSPGQTEFTSGDETPSVGDLSETLKQAWKKSNSRAA